MITKETAIELAKEAGGLPTEFGINCTKGMRFHNLDTLTSLCNLAVAHAQKDAEPVHQWRKKLTDEPWHDATKEEAYSWIDEYYEGRTLYTHPEAKDVEPVALLDGNGENVYFPSDAMFHYWLGRNCTKLYTRPAHDDTALLRQALEALLSANNDCQELSHHKGDFHKLGEPCKPMQRFEFAITALRERLGEKV